MDEQFREVYVKRMECGDENVRQKTEKIIRQPTSGSFGGESELKDVWTTHAGALVLGWDVVYEDGIEDSPAEASNEDIEEVYLWFILDHDSYEDGSAVPLKKPTGLELSFQVRMFYPAYNGPEETVEEPWSIQSNLLSIYNETDGIWGVSPVHDHDQIDECVVLEGKTTHEDIDVVQQVTRDDVHLEFEDDSDLS